MEVIFNDDGTVSLDGKKAKDERSLVAMLRSKGSKVTQTDLDDLIVAIQSRAIPIEPPERAAGVVSALSAWFDELTPKLVPIPAPEKGNPKPFPKLP